MSVITVYSDETDPDVRLAWRDMTGTLRSFVGWTLRAEVVDPATNTVVLNKTSGVTGSDGTGLSNVNISWSAVELAQIQNGVVYRLRVVAVNGSEVAVFTIDLRGGLPLLRVLTKPT
jgi:hypothetical protein